MTSSAADSSEYLRLLHQTARRRLPDEALKLISLMNANSGP